MNLKTVIGIILIVLGVVGFIAKGITYTDEDTVVDLGPLEIESEQEKTIPIAPIAAGVALLSGVVLVSTGRKSDG